MAHAELPGQAEAAQPLGGLCAQPQSMSITTYQSRQANLAAHGHGHMAGRGGGAHGLHRSGLVGGLRDSVRHVGLAERVEPGKLVALGRDIDRLVVGLGYQSDRVRANLRGRWQLFRVQSRSRRRWQLREAPKTFGGGQCILPQDPPRGRLGEKWTGLAKWPRGSGTG